MTTPRTPPKRPPVITIAKMTRRGRVMLPKAVVDHFGFEPGDEIAFVEDETGTHIRRHFRVDPIEDWIGVVTDIKGDEIDAYIDAMRGRD